MFKEAHYAFKQQDPHYTFKQFIEPSFHLTFWKRSKKIAFLGKEHSNQCQENNWLRLINITNTSLRILKFSDVSMSRRGWWLMTMYSVTRRLEANFMESKHGWNLELERHQAREKKKKETTYITGFINSRSKPYAIDAVLADMLLSPLQNYGVHRATPAS